jgi:phospholipase C
MRAAAALALAFVLSCDDGPPPLPGPAEWNRPVTPPESDAAALKMRRSCGYARGALPAETHGADTPNGRTIPIEHVFVVMMENRSFDHYFQKLPSAGITDVEVAPEGFTNLDLSGAPVGITRETLGCFVDTAHGWNKVHRQINGGKMDGFVTTNDGSHDLPMGGDPAMAAGGRAMTFYAPEDVPFMYWAAKNFAIADHYFCSVPGPTWPNRMYLYGASSRGKSSNEFVDHIDATLFDELTQREVSWAFYHQRVPGFAVFLDVATKYWGDHLLDWAVFEEDLAAGRLPKVVFLDPGYGRNDDHPPLPVDLGQRFLADVTRKLMNSSYWEKSALFITWDEHGGLYDHVAPPPACPPDERAPELLPGDEAGGFDVYGVRVPLLVLSPYARAGFVGHKVYDHTSITRFIEARWQLPALSNRDANAEVPWELFDFAAPPRSAPPPPEVTVNQARADACKALFGEFEL